MAGSCVMQGDNACCTFGESRSSKSPPRPCMMGMMVPGCHRVYRFSDDSCLFRAFRPLLSIHSATGIAWNMSISQIHRLACCASDGYPAGANVLGRQYPVKFDVHETNVSFVLAPGATRMHFYRYSWQPPLTVKSQRCF